MLAIEKQHQLYLISAQPALRKVLETMYKRRIHPVSPNDGIVDISSIEPRRRKRFFWDGTVTSLQQDNNSTTQYQ